MFLIITKCIFKYVINVYKSIFIILIYDSIYTILRNLWRFLKAIFTFGKNKTVSQYVNDVFGTFWTKFIGESLYRILLNIDRFGNGIFFGDPERTISARVGEWHLGSPLYKVLDWIDPDHCDSAYTSWLGKGIGGENSIREYYSQLKRYNI